MRRLYPLLAAAGVLGLALGCHHVHGVCDCDMRSPITTGVPLSPYQMTPVPPPPLAVRPVEQLKELPMPKEKDKDAPPQTESN